MEEEWRRLKDYPKYEVSNLSNIRECKTHKVPTISKAKTGYVIVYLPNRKRQILARLVASEFKENPYNWKFIKYEDNDRSNISLDNLYWAKSKSYRVGAVQLSVEDIKEIRRLSYDEGIKAKEIAKMFKITHRYCLRVINYEAWSEIE